MRAKIFGGGLVLVYHRVTRLSTDPQALTVAPEHFTEQLDVLRRHAHPLPLVELVDRAQHGRLPARAVAVTFDDGYSDNLVEASPLLEQAAVPATVFVTTGGIGRAQEFYWDDLDRILLQPGVLPANLALTIGPSSYAADLGGDARLGESAWEERRRWNLLQARAPGARERIYAELCERLRPIDERARVEVLERVRAWSGCPAPPRATHRIMNAAEIARLAGGGLVEIGAHTVTHPVLATLSPTAQRVEIFDSRSTLEEIVGRRVTSFAYPFGNRAHYQPETAALVREAGFERACANGPALVDRWANPFEVPRGLVRDWNGDEFAHRLDEWFHG
jgi:peptidoglycan/xylan/chitin deacetylase (PgdA/CDA1 family)